jgi:hypothetical protein
MIFPEATISDARLPWLKPKVRKKLVLQVARDMGMAWRRRHLDRYFTTPGYREFKFAPRSGQGNRRPANPRLRKHTYYERKRREKGHVRPLVWSGELRQIAVYGGRWVHVGGTSKKVWAKMPMPRKANLKHPNSDAHPIKELRSTSNKVMKDLNKTVQKSTDAQFRKIK